MLMNKRKYHRLLPLLLLAMVSMAVLGAGTENEANEPATTSEQSKEPEKVSSEAGEMTAGAPESADKAPAENAAPPRPLKEFKPTDKIEADSAVSFPIDI